MKPVNSQYSTAYTLSENIVWTGPNIPCLEICTGQLINGVVAAIAQKTCDALEPYDLSTLTIECVLDILGKDETGDRTLVSILQLLSDGECTLNDKITSLSQRVDGLSDTALVVDLKCFRTTDNFGNEIPYNEQSVLQLIINEACLNKTTVAGIGGEITEIKEEIENIWDAIPSGEEPIITTCISSNKPVSQSVKDIAANYCDYKQDVGDSFQIQQNISKIATEVLTNYVGTVGWTITPNNMADFMGNMSLIIEDLYNRTKNIEDNCCNITCKDLTLGFEISPASTDTVYLRFTELAGSDIPPSFVDKGSTLEISDAKGNSLSYNVVIEMNKLLGEFSYAGLDVSSPLTFSLTGIMGNDAITCEKCITRTYSTDGGCPVCIVTATGTEGSVTIVYSVPAK